MIGPLALEVIATSLDDARAAQEGGATRIELVTSLERGGLTPSLAMVEAVLTHVSIPVRVMVRDAEPHQVPDPHVRRRLVDLARAIGQRSVDGLVFGALVDRRIDEGLLDAVSAAAGRPITFHRAFEDLADHDEGLAILARHPAVDHVLCDGGSGGWAERALRLGTWATQAGSGLQVLPGGGITRAALAVLSRVPGLHEVHVGRLVREPATVEGRVSALRVADLVAHLRQLRPSA